jgi:signal transduction histidine kinase
LAGAVEDFVGTSHSSFIVDDRGYVASHVDIRYIGSLLSDDSVVQTVLRGDRTSGSAQFKDFDGQAVAADFEKVDRTNLYTVITTPTAALIASVDDSMRRIWLFVAIAAVLVLVCSVWLTQRDSEPSILAASLDRENDHSFSDKHVDDRVDGRVGHESGDDWAVAKAIRLDGSTAIHSSFQEPTGLSTLTPGLESLLRETTLAALGHLQLLRAALGLRVEADDESLRHVEAIEREVRLVKTVIDRAHVLSAPIEPLDRQIKVSLQNVIQAAVAHQRPHIDADSIRFETSIENVPTILGDAVELVQSIEAILQNSIEAVHNRVPREVALSLKARDGRVVVSIRDTGIGMSRSMLARALEPFAKAFESPHHLGTGLAFVKRMAERHSAHCEIHSTPGEGTDVTLVFPVQSEDWRDFELQRTKPQPERQSEGAKVSGLADSQATPKFASLTPLSESLVQSLKMPRVPNLPSMPNEFESKDSESIDSEQPPPIPVVAEAKSFAGASVFADDKNLKSIDWQVESLPETSFETDLEPAVAARFEVSSVKIRKPKKRNAVNKND